jgi:hypothetical protein
MTSKFAGGLGAFFGVGRVIVTSTETKKTCRWREPSLGAWMELVGTQKTSFIPAERLLPDEMVENEAGAFARTPRRGKQCTEIKRRQSDRL